MTLNLETTILPGGMTIAINTYTAPDSFNEDLMNSLLTYHEGLQFDVYVNGERIESRVPNSPQMMKNSRFAFLIASNAYSSSKLRIAYMIA